MQPSTVEPYTPPAQHPLEVARSLAPHISVVVPCYNAARYIEATLQSIFAQQGVGLDVIVVDDGSSDESAARVGRLFPKVRLIQQANAGVAAARNVGIRAAKADWVAFCDADDVWLPDKLAAQWKALQAEPAAQLAYAAWHVWHSQGDVPTPDLLAELQAVKGGEERWRGASGWIYPELLVDCVVWTSTVLARRSLLLDLGGFDESLRVGEDYDLWLRASRHTPILRVPRPLALYRMHGDNTTQQAPRANYKGEVLQRALSRWGYTAPDGRRADRRVVAAGLARSWSDYAGAMLAADNVREARAAALQAVRMHPGRWLGWQVLLQASARSLLGWAR